MELLEMFSSSDFWLHAESQSFKSFRLIDTDWKEKNL